MLFIYLCLTAATGLLKFADSSITHQDPSKLHLDAVDQRRHYSAQNQSFNPLANSKSFRVKRGQPSGINEGPVKCDANTPCIDTGCCGPQNVCGFGPDYCGKGCQGNCHAKAPCGRDSADDGNIPCGMNLCCSYYGWCGVDDNYCTAGEFGCQQAYGTCQTQQPFNCPGGDASKRTVSYYQGSNVYSADRKCQNVKPSDLDTSKHTHLYWAFAQISSSHEVIASDPRYQALYKDFTALQSGNLQTWISIGGFDFTTANPDAWSSMVATSASRKTFINSLVAFMRTYEFQGVDLDWEYPVDPKRGGRQDDMKNLVSLLREMRAEPSFGQSFGISVTLAPDIYYLQHFDAKGLIKYATFLGFMSYDLHGTWDGALANVGKKVYGQADGHDIERDLMPMWFDLSPTDMQKVNFGLSNYGRGYTLADISCAKADGSCFWTAGSKAAACSGQEGVMSILEIKQLIKDRDLTPSPLVGPSGSGKSMMKQITWDDQWMGYDDEETIKAKVAFAGQRCFGGTMSWSIDLATGGDLPPPPNTIRHGQGDKDLCNDDITPDLWKNNDLGNFIVAACKQSSSEKGLISTLNDEFSSRNTWSCSYGPGKCSATEPWNFLCTGNPKAAVVEYSIAQFVSVLDIIRTYLEDATHSLEDQAGDMVETFYPDAPSTDNSGDIGTALSAIGSLIGILPGLGPAIGAGASVAGSVVSGMAKQETVADVDLKDIKSSWASIYDSIIGDIKQLSNFGIDSSDGGPKTLDCDNPNNPVQILRSGDFSQKMILGSNDLPNAITASFSSVAINYMWSQQNVVVIKVSKNTLSFDPCESGRLFANDVKYCDADGNMYVLQTFRDDLIYMSWDVKSNEVPGFDSLSKFALTPAAISLSSKTAHEDGGYRSASPDASGLTDHFKDALKNPNSDQLLGALVQFNLPFCDLDTADPHLSNGDQDPVCLYNSIKKYCDENQPGNRDCTDQAEFNVHMYCECWQQKDKNGNDWPYQNGRDRRICYTPNDQCFNGNPQGDPIQHPGP